ncbi:MAG: FtsH protease activity modulator HflK [Methylophilaceae bacterium]
MKLPAWAQRNNEGPPDLDEVFRDLNKKINNLFGKKGGNGSRRPPTDSTPVELPIVPIILAVLAIWLATGFYIVDQGSRGIVLQFGRHVETTLPGPHWHIPFPVENVEKVNLEQVRQVEVGYRSEGGSATSKQLRESLMLTDDENIIDLEFAVQYNLKSVEDFRFKNRSTVDSVRAVAETAIREVVGKSKMDFALYEGKEEIATQTKQLMQDVLDRYSSGINVINVTMQNAQPPEQVQAAFDDAVKAKQDLDRQRNEGQAYANDVIPKARGTAARLREEAEGYKLRVESEARGNTSRFEQVLAQYNKAPEVTRQRIYMEAQEQVLSNATKVIVNQKNGASLLNLPLDKLMAATAASQGAAVSSRTSTKGAVTPDKTPDRSLDTRDRSNR